MDPIINQHKKLVIPLLCLMHVALQNKVNKSKALKCWFSFNFNMHLKVHIYNVIVCINFMHSEVIKSYALRSALIMHLKLFNFNFNLCVYVCKIFESKLLQF